METITIPDHLKTDYPFHSNFLTVEHLGKSYRLNYVDEKPVLNTNADDVETIIMVHGNPTWSFFYRNLIKHFKKNYRIIVPDHLGCGLSDKPTDFSYQLKDHINNLESLVDHLKLEKYHLIVHDWGGAIGSGLAVHQPEKVLSITYMNTGAFTSDKIPWRIDILRKYNWGEWLIRKFNAFAMPATFMAVEKPLSKTTIDGYLLPYNNYQNRIATAKFVKDIPMDETHPSFTTLKNIELNLHKIKAPVLLMWGAKDFCFTMDFFHRFKEFFPNSEEKVFPNAGHYLLEDEPKATLETIENFYANLKGTKIEH